MAQFKMYTTTWCSYCKNLKRQLDKAGIAYDEVDVEKDPAAAELVMSFNGGNRTVPTLEFEDGSALTNPSLCLVVAKLAERGADGGVRWAWRRRLAPRQAAGN